MSVPEPPFAEPPVPRPPVPAVPEPPLVLPPAATLEPPLFAVPPTDALPPPLPAPACVDGAFEHAHMMSVKVTSARRRGMALLCHSTSKLSQADLAAAVSVPGFCIWGQALSLRPQPTSARGLCKGFVLRVITLVSVPL